MGERLNLYTHDGQFHADEVFATAMFSIISDDLNIVRGSDTDIPQDTVNWIIYDIGGGALDHHSVENKERNGTHPGTDVPYAACGLVWKKYYQEVLEALDCPESYMVTVFRRIENSLVIGIDAVDNGYDPVLDAVSGLNLDDAVKSDIVQRAKTGMSVSQIIKDFNPPWNSSMDPFDAFMDAVSFAKDILLNRIDSIISSLDGRDYVMQCIYYSGEHMMIMDEFAPWEGVIYSRSSYDPKAHDIWFVISPALRGGWNVQCVLLDSDDRSSYRHALPSEWYGLRYEELQKVSGVETAVFCHPSGFLAGAGTKSDAVRMARIAMEKKQ
jgi:uncharacterized UPF0160 family protein